MTHGALILARYSTDNQSEQTIEVQVQNCAKYCEEHNLEVLDVFADYGISGMKKTRPAYERMMASLRSGIGDTVVIYDQSRMFRSLTSWFEFREELQSLGASVVSVTQSFIGGDITDPSVFMAEGVSAVFNQMWVLQTRQKVLSNKTHNAMQGKHLGGKPALGYRKGADGFLEIEPSEAETVRLIFNLFDSGHTYSEIIAELNSRGLKTKSGSRFGKNSLHDLLKNEKYIGNVISRNYGTTPSGGHSRRASDGSRAIRVDGACPSIISKEQFSRVQKRMAAHIQKGGRPVSTTDQPLKGKVFCSCCGSSMTIRYSRGADGDRTYCYYRCVSKKNHATDCDTKPIRRDVLERMVAEQVRSCVSSPDYRNELRSYLYSFRNKSGFSESIKSVEKEIESVTTKINNGLSALMDGMDSPALRSKIRQLENHRSSLEASRLELIDRSESNISISESEIDWFIDSLESMSGADDRALLSIVSRVEIGNETIKVYTIFDGPPDRPRPKSFELLSAVSDSDICHNSTISTGRTIGYAQGAVAMLWTLSRH